MSLRHLTGSDDSVQQARPDRRGPSPYGPMRRRRWHRAPAFRQVARLDCRARDLRQRAGGMPGMTSIAAMVARQLAGAPESARVVAPTLPGHEPGEVDAALGSHARLERSDIVIAGLGPILASAAAAEELAADRRLLPVSVPTAKVGTGQRVLHDPPPASLQTDTGVVITRRTGGAGASTVEAIAFDLAQEPRAPGADLDRAPSWCWRSERRALPRSSHLRTQRRHANCPKPPENRLTARRSDRRGPPEAAGGAGKAADLLDRDEPKVRLRFEITRHFRSWLIGRHPHCRPARPLSGGVPTVGAAHVRHLLR
jgi:hypothetical protein